MAVRCENCNKKSGMMDHYQCPKCKRIVCNHCVGGIFTGKCPFCGEAIHRRDKID